MRIVDPGTEQLPNGLVLHHIKSLEAKFTEQKRMHSIPPNLTSALRDVKTQLNRPATQDTIVTHGQLSKSQIAHLTKTLTSKRFRLLPSEALMMLNHRPETREELAGLIEDLEERLSEEKQDELLAAVRKVFEGVKEER